MQRLRTLFISPILWLFMAATAVACGRQLPLATAWFAWAGLVAVVCAGGAFLISRQPLGIVTFGGYFGSSFVHWGFRAGRGHLLPAIGISWLIWLILGGAIITGTRFPTHIPIIACLTCYSLGLFYIFGVMLGRQSGGSIPASLVKIVFVLLGLIGGSSFLWFHAGTDSARATAMAIAGGPPLLIGVGYGCFLLISLFSGGRRWN